MQFSTTLIAVAAMLPSVLAWGPDFITFCTQENPEGFTCLGHFKSETCAKSLMDIERENPGKWNTPEFYEPFCTIPSDRWTRLEAAMTACGNYEMKTAVNAYTAMCNYNKMQSQRPYICNPKNQNSDTMKELASYVCIGHEPTAPVTSSKVPEPSASKPLSYTSKVPESSVSKPLSYTSEGPLPSASTKAISSGTVKPASSATKPATSSGKPVPSGDCTTSSTILPPVKTTTKIVEDCPSSTTVKPVCTKCAGSTTQPSSNGTAPIESAPAVVTAGGSVAAGISVAALVCAAAALF